MTLTTVSTTVLYCDRYDTKFSDTVTLYGVVSCNLMHHIQQQRRPKHSNIYHTIAKQSSRYSCNYHGSVGSRGRRKSNYVIYFLCNYLKSANISQSYERTWSGNFYGSRCIAPFSSYMTLTLQSTLRVSHSRSLEMAPIDDRISVPIGFPLKWR